MTPEFVFILIVWSLLGWVALAASWSDAQKYITGVGRKGSALKYLGRAFAVQLAAGPLVWLLFFACACAVIFTLTRHNWEIYRLRQLMQSSGVILEGLRHPANADLEERLHNTPAGQILFACCKSHLERPVPVEPAAEPLEFATARDGLPGDMVDLWDVAKACIDDPSQKNMAEFKALCRPDYVMLGLSAYAYLEELEVSQQVDEADNLEQEGAPPGC